MCVRLPMVDLSSVGRRSLFLPLVHFILKWFISVETFCLFHAPELHPTQVHPTSSCCPAGIREQTLLRRKSGDGWGSFFQVKVSGVRCKHILLYHFVILTSGVFETLWILALALHY